MSLRTTLGRVDWPVALFIGGYQIAVLAALPLYLAYRSPGVGLVVTSLVVLFLTEVGIGGAYHRYYSHRCYRLRRPAELALLSLATLAIQGSAVRWSHDHRKHHAHVDTDDDPYSIRRGFFYAHMGWMFFRGATLNERLVRDLLRDPLLRFQHRWHAVLGLGGNCLLFVAGGLLFGDWLGAFIILWWTRLLVSHHLTWFVNSLAHTWGERTYSREHSAVDNYIVALLTCGEGYHNYHHTFASDYRNGVRWFHYDPTKWTIWLLSRIGQAGSLKRYDSYNIRRRLILEDQKLLLETLRGHAHRKRLELEHRIHELSEALHAKLARLRTLAEESKRLRREPGARAVRASLRRERRIVRQSLRHDWRAWSNLCGAILEPA